MSISSLTTSAASVLAPSIPGTTSAADPNADDGAPQPGTVHGSHGHHHGGGHMMQALMQALDQLGLGATSAAVAASAATASTSTGTDTADADSDPDAATQSVASADVRQALHTLMHDLFQAIRTPDGATQAAAAPGDADGSGAAAAATAPASAVSAYEGFGDRLQSLIQGLASTDGANSADSAAGKLQQDFSQLMSALGQSSPADGARASGAQATVTLQSFLTQVEQNVEARQAAGANATAPSGGLLSVSA